MMVKHFCTSKVIESTAPELPGCHSQGKTVDELLQRTMEAIEVYLEALDAQGLEPRIEFVGVQRVKYGVRPFLGKYVFAPALLWLGLFPRELVGFWIAAPKRKYWPTLCLPDAPSVMPVRSSFRHARMFLSGIFISRQY